MAHIKKFSSQLKKTPWIFNQNKIILYIEAEIDYVIQIKNNIVPIEVKSGTTGSLKSLREYLNYHHADYMIRFSGHNYSQHENLLSYPLYAIAKALNIEWFKNSYDYIKD